MEQPSLPFERPVERPPVAPRAASPPSSTARASAREGAARAPAPARVFLGWERPALAAAAEWILRELGTDLGDALVALPGARAARRLLEHLARRAPPSWTPPRVTTHGKLTDLLVRMDLPVAGRLARTLAWEEALAGLAPPERGRLTRTPERGDTPRERLRLAEAVRTLHAELAVEGVAFDALARGPAPEIEEEALRWRALAKAQSRYLARLDELGLCDPHAGRLAAIERGAVERGLRIVLVGVADMPHLLARLLEAIPERVWALVVAPPSEADAFDALGRLWSAAWAQRDVPLATERWRVTERPADQADVVSDVLAAAGDGVPAGDVAIGIADDEVVPYLERRLAAAGARALVAAGTPFARTRPARMLAAVARYLARGGFAELAELARDPDLGPDLLPDAAAAAHLDRYHVEHLPRGGRGGWVEDEKHRASVERVHARLEERLGALASDERRPLPAWTPPIRALLQRVHAGALDPADEGQRALAEALALVGRALGELDALPERLAAGRVSAAEAIECALALARGERVPPRPAAAGEAVVELLGWLELALDDAPHLVVTGFQEGCVPRAPAGSPLLPDGARRSLGLPSDEDRLARDVYAATVILASRPAAVFVTGRRNGLGDPLVPSRLAFHRPVDEIVARVRHFLPPEEDRRVRARLGASGRDHACPRIAGRTAPEEMTVSSFRTYLASPYLYYLEHVLRLRTIDDRARELDPLHFGSLAHTALEVLAEDGVRDELDERGIARALAGRVDALVAACFGADPLPAVRLQAEQLKHRLGLFAAAEAERRRAGWRIHGAEVERRVSLDVDGTPVTIKGKLDRVDVHADGRRWAILDYKAGEDVRDPGRTHRRGETWTDLQLPLYRFLGRGLGFAGEPELGYGAIGKDARGVRFLTATWTPAELDLALEEARRVVRCVRAGAFEERGRPPYEEIPRALWGEGMVGDGADDDAEEPA